MCGLADGKAAFEHGNGRVAVAFAEVKLTYTNICLDKAVGVIDGFGNPHRFVADDHTRGEAA